jgi:hypothetical protein
MDEKISFSVSQDTFRDILDIFSLQDILLNFFAKVKVDLSALYRVKTLPMRQNLYELIAMRKPCYWQNYCRFYWTYTNNFLGLNFVHEAEVEREHWR